AYRGPAPHAVEQVQPLHFAAAHAGAAQVLAARECRAPSVERLHGPRDVAGGGDLREAGATSDHEPEEPLSTRAVAEEIRSAGEEDGTAGRIRGRYACGRTGARVAAGDRGRGDLHDGRQVGTANASEIDLRAGRAARPEEVGRLRFEHDRVAGRHDGEVEEGTQLARGLEDAQVRTTARAVAARELMDLVERTIRPEDLRDAGVVPVPEQVGARGEGHTLTGLV